MIIFKLSNTNLFLALIGFRFAGRSDRLLLFVESNILLTLLTSSKVLIAEVDLSCPVATHVLIVALAELLKSCMAYKIFLKLVMI